MLESTKPSDDGETAKIIVRKIIPATQSPNFFSTLQRSIFPSAGLSILIGLISAPNPGLFPTPVSLGRTLLASFVGVTSYNWATEYLQLNPVEGGNVVNDKLLCGMFGGISFGIIASYQNPMTHYNMKLIGLFATVGATISLSNHYIQQFYISWKENRLQRSEELEKIKSEQFAQDKKMFGERAHEIKH